MEAEWFVPILRIWRETGLRSHLDTVASNSVILKPKIESSSVFQSEKLVEFRVGTRFWKFWLSGVTHSYNCLYFDENASFSKIKYEFVFRIHQVL